MKKILVLSLIAVFALASVGIRSADASWLNDEEGEVGCGSWWMFFLILIFLILNFLFGNGDYTQPV